MIYRMATDPSGDDKKDDKPKPKGGTGPGGDQAPPLEPPTAH